jgi:hypothetical protein
MPNLIKIRPMGAELFHEYGKIGLTKLITAVHNFVNVPKTANMDIIWVLT